MCKIHQIYFSPTGSTAKIISQIAASIAPFETETVDLTKKLEAPKIELAECLALIGVPVYAGRVPEICLQRMEKIRGKNTPAVLVVVYGNRAFEDTLVELQDFVEARGFKVIAAAAFIGEHSFSTVKQPVAANRPDNADLMKAAEFGKMIVNLSSGKLVGDLLLPGKRPYQEGLKRAGTVAPDTDQRLCIACGACERACPVETVRLQGRAVVTDASRCILCCACVKVCPTGARFLEHPMVTDRRKLLVENCTQRKEPEFFIP